MTELVFPKDLYTDVRIEDTYNTTVAYENGILKQNRSRTEVGALIRVFDGERWYYSAISNIKDIQQSIDELARMATPNPAIKEHPIITRMEVNRDQAYTLQVNSCRITERAEKQKLLERYIAVISEYKDIALWNLAYLDKHLTKHIRTSLGTDVLYDKQFMSVFASYTINLSGHAPFSGYFYVLGTAIGDIDHDQEALREKIRKHLAYTEQAVHIEPGVYTCILSPQAAGIFAHESFGHKSEADFMVGDVTMLREWELGKTVGSPMLNIIDVGSEFGSGYTPYDDEGSRARKNYLIKDGKLVGRLHSAMTAADLNESLTGNARALNFEFEPIVRMTTTYIDKGSMTKDELFGGVKLGIFADEIGQGSGMSTFTMAPCTAYMIRDGRLAEPVKISVISGNVMKTLNEIDGLSDTLELLSFPVGGCGKMEQSPLPVGFGGPFVRVNNLTVQ